MQPISSSYLMTTTERPDPVLVRGNGSLVWDSNGHRYLDFVQGWATNALGHSAPEVTQALTAQAARLVAPSPAFFNEPLLALAQRLTELTGLHQAYVSCTGAEAVECAIKLARKWGRKQHHGAYEIISTRGAFHGRTLAAMAASGKPGWDQLFPPYPAGFTKVAFGDLDAMRKAIGARTVALLVEPIQGEAGVVVPPAGYLAALRELADEHGLLLVFDEVQTGLGRTGRLFAHEWEGVKPDILTLGKGLGGGIPIAATLGNARACCFETGDQGGTFHGAPLACSVALAVLQAITSPELLGHVRAAGERLARGLEACVARRGLLGSRGRGLLQALELGRPTAHAVRDACLAHGLLVNAPRDSLLRFMPSLRVTGSEIDAMLEILDRALGEAG
ncbi:MAG: aminotransferase class III-fold pyridoxal phosphate-dependent enzyme [Polyangiaceae bacterium]|nr:aminotransferase class III-fold pyridoxal phosphate-dependent enzyme [Polyangiaceae bacterium]